MRTLAIRIANALAIAVLVVSYCLVVYMFVAKEGLLENQIGRITAVIDVGAVVGFLSLKQLFKKFFPVSLWISALILLIATAVQSLAVLELHSVVVRVVVSGEPAAVANSSLDVHFSDSVPELQFRAREDDSAFLFGTEPRVMVWKQPETVVAVEQRTGTRQTVTLDWPLESIWDIWNERRVNIRLELKQVAIKVEVNPASAMVSLKAYTGQDTVRYPDFSSGESRYVNIGDRVQIKAWSRGYYAKSDDLGFQEIQDDTVLQLSLSPKPSEVIVEAFNVGGDSVRGAVVIIDEQPTPHRAFEKFALPWGTSYDIAAEYVRIQNDRFRSTTYRLHLGRDTVAAVRCTLRAVN